MGEANSSPLECNTMQNEAFHVKLLETCETCMQFVGRAAHLNHKVAFNPQVLGFLGCVSCWPAGGGMEYNWVQLALQAHL